MLIASLLCLSLSASNVHTASIKSEIETEILSKQEQKSPQVETDFAHTMDVLYEQSENYKILTDANQTGYLYNVQDNNGNLLDIGYHSYRGSFGFSLKNDILTLDYGAGGPTWYERYYDVNNGRVSRFFEQPIATSKEMVAYFTIKDDNEIVLVVQNMFDTATYYRAFTGDFSNDVFKTKVKGEFSEDNTCLTVSYQTNSEKFQMTTTFLLR